SIARSPGVEGFLPIGALMGWRTFFETGAWDPIHPAAMAILGFACIISLFLRKSFCGWFCPAGTVSEWMWKLGKRFFGKNYQIPLWVDYPLRSLKYLLLLFFLWIILSMSGDALAGFLQGPYYKMADVKMLFFFTRMSLLTAVVLAILILSSLFVRNSWCRYLCPYGALMGLFALLSPTRIQRNPETCIDCKSCSEVCPYHLPVHQKVLTRSPECNGCMDCTLVCPVENTLDLKTMGFRARPWSPAGVGAVIIMLFIGVYCLAQATGHWKSTLTAEEFRMRLAEIDSPLYTHPSISPENIHIKGDLPGKLDNLKLSKIIKGDEAEKVVHKMHGKRLGAMGYLIAHYGSDDSKNILYVSVYENSEVTKYALMDMAMKMVNGTKIFKPLETIGRMGDSIVFKTEGMGLVHYFYRVENILLWWQAEPDKAELTYHELLTFDFMSLKKRVSPKK
ncbi:MAG: 4Fe-4S binding protein, partial [Deltaproteobacteria bacterium]|nr:4Fe-4S binding protein [Deltaproteobacteria bacterium]